MQKKGSGYLCRVSQRERERDFFFFFHFYKGFLGFLFLFYFWTSLYCFLTFSPYSYINFLHKILHDFFQKWRGGGYLQEELRNGRLALVYQVHQNQLPSYLPFHPPCCQAQFVCCLIRGRWFVCCIIRGCWCWDKVQVVMQGVL